MTPDQLALLLEIRDKLNRLDKSGIYNFSKDIQMMDGRNVRVGTRTGTIFGTEPTQKLGFWGKTPDSQQLKANHNNWASLSDIVSALVSIGLFDQE